jgi:hypothetical protein
MEYIELNGMCIEVDEHRQRARVYEVFDHDEAWEACDHVPSLPEDHGASILECQAWADLPGSWAEIEEQIERDRQYQEEVAHEEYMLGEW